VRHLLLAAGVALASPVQAQDLCAAVWDRLVLGAAILVPVSGTVRADGAACEVSGVEIDMPGDYTPVWVIERLRLSGGALGWIAGAGGTPDRLEIAVEGLSFQLRTGMADLDYIHAAQARANPTRLTAALEWQADARRLVLERLEVDLPGDNAITLTAAVEGVDLSSAGAMQMSLTGAALREADLTVQSHGFFEFYLLPWLGNGLLPLEGDVEAAAAALQARATEVVAGLPGAQFPGDSRAALAALIAELPNPAGTLTLSFRADPGFGAARFAGYAGQPLPATLEAAAPLLQGVTVGIGWTHEEIR
jgi:hypothetical protein